LRSSDFLPCADQHAIGGLSDSPDELRADGDERGAMKAGDVFGRVAFDLNHEDAAKGENGCANVSLQEMLDGKKRVERGLALRLSRGAATTLRAIAEALNARGIQTPRGRKWEAMSVKNALARA
jgi:hypothetical protein